MDTYLLHLDLCATLSPFVSHLHRISPGKKTEKEDEDPNQPTYVGEFPQVVRNEQANLMHKQLHGSYTFLRLPFKLVNWFSGITFHHLCQVMHLTLVGLTKQPLWHGLFVEVNFLFGSTCHPQNQENVSCLIFPQL